MELDELELEAVRRMLLLEEEPFNFNFPPITIGLEDFAATTLDMVVVCLCVFYRYR